MTMSTKIFASAQKTMEAKGNIRKDLAVTDYRMIDKVHANILVGFTANKPTVKELASFIVAKFEGKAFPILETASCYDACKCVGITIMPPQITRPKDDCPKMVKIHASTFIDVADNSEWSLQKNPTTGVQYLARAISEDFESIISSRKARLGSCLAVTASTNFSVVTASYLNANEDDYVKFFDDGLMRTGTIRSVEPDGKTVKIMDDNGEVFVTSRENVTQVIRKDPAETEMIKNNMEHFYEQFLPESYVSQLFSHGPFVK